MLFSFAHLYQCVKIEYGMGELYLDLMNFAASHLESEGRLVFWVPVIREHYKVRPRMNPRQMQRNFDEDFISFQGDESLPRHPSLKLVANCEQVLSSHTSRRLLVMEKAPAAKDSSEKASAATKEQESSASTDAEGAETVKLTSAEFREHFYKQYNNIPRKDRKERLKKYGHLNLAGDPAADAKEEDDGDRQKEDS